MVAIVLLGVQHYERATQVQINTNFQRKIVNIFLPIIFSICFECSKKTSQ